MSILFRKVLRRSNPVDKDSAKKVYPVITYQYTNAADLSEVAKVISGYSGVSEGETFSVLKDFRTELKKFLLSGRSVNIDGLGYFYLAAKSNGTDKADDFMATDINGLRICFRANRDIRIVASGTTRSEGLNFKDVDRINDGTSEEDNGGDGGKDSPSDGGDTPSGGDNGADDNPLG